MTASGEWATAGITSNYWYLINFNYQRPIVQAVSWINRNSAPESPQTGKFQISEDSVTWTDVGTFTATNSTGGAKQRFLVQNPAPAKYFRIYISTSFAGCVNPGFGILQLFGKWWN
jgi:hypothetical protein